MSSNKFDEFWLPGKNNKIFSPKSDFAFKKVFGNPNNKDIVAGFLETITILNMSNDEYLGAEFSDTFLNRERKGGKYSILDLVITTKSGHKIDLEMQNKKYNYFEKRIDYYAARCASKQLDGSDDYNKLQRSIVIFILGHKYFLNNQKPISRWRFRNDDGDYLNNTLEAVVLELPKVLKNHIDDPLYDWVDFFKAKTESDLDKCATKSKTIKKAVSILKEISADKQTQLSYEAWIRDIRMQNCVYDTGRDEGRAEGLAEGETNAKIEDVISFAKTGMSLSQICQTLKVDENIKNQAIKKLNEMGIKYNA